MTRGPAPPLPEDLPFTGSENTRHVLLLMEDGKTRDALGRIVERLGFTCRKVNSGEEALTRFLDGIYALVILDIQASEKDGLDLLKKAKRCHPDSDIIVVTGSRTDYSFRDVVLAGASDVIPKPVNLDEVEAKIDRVFRERRLRKELERKNRQLRKYLEDLKLAKDRLEEQAGRLKGALSEIEKANEVIERQNQKILKANWELEKADKMKSNFLATVSHELRTPLNAIIGFLGLVLDDLCEDREEEKSLLRDALTSSNNLLFLINNMLDLAKIEAGKLDIFLEKIDLQDVLCEVTNLLSIQAREKGLYLRHRFEGIPPVYADRGKVRQVLTNLLGNAIKFTEEGGVEVQARCLDGELVEIEVRDTGIGVPVEQQRHVFEQFFQADKNYKRKQVGTGLGLVISKNLVEMMGGRIRLVSQGEGKGSQISFTLPLWKETSQDPSLPGEPSSTASQRVREAS